MELFLLFRVNLSIDRVEKSNSMESYVNSTNVPSGWSEK